MDSANDGLIPFLVRFVETLPSGGGSPRSGLPSPSPTGPLEELPVNASITFNIIMIRLKTAI